MDTRGTTSTATELPTIGIFTGVIAAYLICGWALATEKKLAQEQLIAAPIEFCGEPYSQMLKVYKSSTYAKVTCSNGKSFEFSTR